MTASRGFSLMEVLVALAVIAIVLGAVVQTTTVQSDHLATLRDRTLAHWVASNRIAEIHALRQLPPVGRNQGRERMGEIRWEWSTVVSGTDTDGIRRIDVEVRRNVSDEQPLVTMTGFAGAW